MFKKTATLSAVIIPVFLILHFLGWWKGYYDLNGYDKLVHFLAGISVVLAVFWILEIRPACRTGRDIKIKNKQLTSLIVLFFISVGWEIIEYSAYHFIGQQEINCSQTGWLDTFGDFTANFAGATVVLIWSHFQEKR